MQEILVLGDSHSPIFNHPLFKEKFPNLFFNVLTVIGATASGLENPNSTTQAYPVFREAVRQTAAKQVIVMLGEVDTGFRHLVPGAKIPGVRCRTDGQSHRQLFPVFG